MLVWLARYIEGHPWLHAQLLRIWRSFPPRLAGFLKGQFARSWLVGAVAVMIDEATYPAARWLLQHDLPHGTELNNDDSLLMAYALALDMES